MKKIIYLTSLCTASIVCVSMFIHAKQSPIKTAKQYVVKAIKHPDTLFFANEKVPLKEYDIKERLDREFLVNTYWQSNGLLLIKRSHKFFPIIEPILAEYGIPNDFKYLAVIESGLQNITSPAGAKGFWQLMPVTAKEYGLEVNKNVDERYHLKKATIAACKYLLTAKRQFGNWTSAAASYNMGMTGLRNKFAEQKVNSYYDLLLSNETMRYVPRLIAVKEILNHPQDYGFSFDEADLYNLPNYQTVKVDTAISNLANFSLQMKTNYKNLKLLNPWLIEKHLNNGSRKKYEIHIPIQ